jgi:hypothetical protein
VCFRTRLRLKKKRKKKTLDLADDLYLGPIHLASNCLDVVKDVHNKNMSIFGSIVREIKESAELGESTN